MSRNCEDLLTAVGEAEGQGTTRSEAKGSRLRGDFRHSWDEEDWARTSSSSRAGLLVRFGRNFPRVVELYLRSQLRDDDYTASYKLSMRLEEG
jgi:hypothetical protein